MGWEALGQWGDDATRIEPLTGGVANDVWSVRIDGQLAVGRPAPGATPISRAETELLGHLDRAGLAVPVPIPTTDGRRFADGVVVMTYVEGGPPETEAELAARGRRAPPAAPTHAGVAAATGLAIVDRPPARRAPGRGSTSARCRPRVSPDCRAAWARLAGRPTCVVHGNPNSAGNVRVTADRVALDRLGRVARRRRRPRPRAPPQRRRSRRRRARRRRPGLGRVGGRRLLGRRPLDRAARPRPTGRAAPTGDGLAAFAALVNAALTRTSNAAGGRVRRPTTDAASIRRLGHRGVHEQRVDDVDDAQVVRDRHRDHRDQLGRGAADDRAAEHHARGRVRDDLHEAAGVAVDQRLRVGRERHLRDADLAARTRTRRPRPARRRRSRAR